MPLQYLSPGLPTTLAQNVVYALPPVQCSLFTDAVTPTIQQSLSSTFAGTPVALTLVNGQVDVVGGYIRCTSGAISVILKRA